MMLPGLYIYYVLYNRILSNVLTGEQAQICGQFSAMDLCLAAPALTSRCARPGRSKLRSAERLQSGCSAPLWPLDHGVHVQRLGALHLNALLMIR
mmetsp:Transcript_129288/g.228685  ORF Transcript_129288/g.228685 Transcript_129288/m.228685 type:complete len:95 (+) Transcript_129288:3-287(+)